MSGHTTDGNVSNHGATGTGGSEAGQEIKNAASGVNQVGESIRGNINSFADSLGSGGSKVGPGSTTTNETQSGMSKDAETLGNAAIEGLNKLTGKAASGSTTK